MNFAADIPIFMDAFGNADATFQLNGVTVKTVTAIFDQSVEVYSPGQANLTEFKPAITIASSGMDDISRTHTVKLVPKTGYEQLIKTGEYKIYLESEPDGHGLTRIVLVAKK